VSDPPDALGSVVAEAISFAHVGVTTIGTMPSSVGSEPR
jgi:hypothetical protein